MKVHEMIEGLPEVKKNMFFLLAGPCVVESRENALLIAENLKAITRKLNIPWIFKASYKKANRSRIDSFTGMGDHEALQILQEVKEKFNVPVVTDVHTAEEAVWASKVADVIQIPAFLCRQTDLLVAAARTGKTVNIKKGQFLSPDAMVFARDKVWQSGNQKVMLTERGTSFGYRDLVVDMRSIPEMQLLNVPVILDVTHSLQIPNQPAGVTGGQPHYINMLASAGIAAGVDGLFMETHPEPAKALSDGANMLPLHEMEGLLKKLVKIKTAISEA